jgi:AraC-like DNA-binding protein
MSVSLGSTAHSQPQLAQASTLGALAPRSSPSLFTSFSTEDVPVAQRHAYWMANAYRAVEAYVPNPAGLHGRAISCRGAGAQFVRCESSTVHTRLTPQRLRAQLSDEHIAVCLLEAGEYLVEEEDGARVRIGSGELFMFDCGQPMSSVWSESVASYLRLPRHSVTQALGRDPSDFGGSVTPLGAAGLVPFVSSQLRLLASHGPGLASAALEQVMQATVDVSLALVGEHCGRASANSPAAKRRAAYRFMQAQAHRHDLAPEHVAAAIHCSRAQLYRLFEGEALSVRAALQELRLLRSREWLQRTQRNGPMEDSIGTIAHACGFADLSAFGKLFRRRFGMTPGEARLAGPALS